MLNKQTFSSPKTPSIADIPIPRARFIHGSIMRHVITMASAGTIGLIAVFAVDLLSFFYISRLKDTTLTAAIAFATSLGFVQSSISLGMSIGLGAFTGKLIGAGQHDKARELSSAFLVIMLVTTSALGLCTACLAHPLLVLLGAKGETLSHATIYTQIVSPALPLICLGMALSSLLRAVGDAKRAMRVTLTAAIFTAFMDPFLIFGLHLGLTGAAIGTVLSRCIMSTSGFFNLKGHAMIEKPQFSLIPSATQQISKIALPAIGTSLATPVGSLFITHIMARFGLNAVSAFATIDRIVPIAFSFVFALTGSVGPIIAQNLGAGFIGRIKETFLCSLKLTALCVGLMWGLLALLCKFLISLFHIQNIGVEIIHLFCFWTVSSYIFIGLLFISNTIFNNLGKPLYSTGFNWMRATLGTIPFIYIGAYYGGAKGVMIGQALGIALVGSLAMLSAFSVIRKLKIEKI